MGEGGDEQSLANCGSDGLELGATCKLVRAMNGTHKPPAKAVWSGPRRVKCQSNMSESSGFAM